MYNIIDVYGIFAEPVIPGATSRINIKEPRDITTAKLAIAQGKNICVAYKNESAVGEEVNKIGTYCRIESILYENEDNLFIEVYGINRCEILEQKKFLPPTDDLYYEDESDNINYKYDNEYYKYISEDRYRQEMSIKIDDEEFCNLDSNDWFCKHTKDNIEIDDIKNVRWMINIRENSLSYRYGLGNGFNKEIYRALEIFKQDCEKYNLRDLILKIISNQLTPFCIKKNFLESNTWLERFDIFGNGILRRLNPDYDFLRNVNGYFCEVYNGDEYRRMDVYGPTYASKSSEKFDEDEEMDENNSLKSIVRDEEMDENNSLKSIVRDEDTVDMYIKKLESLELDEDIEEKLIKEIDKFKTMAGDRHEVDIKTYLDRVFSIPFNTYTEDRVDFKETSDILNKDQYGLTDVKERILDYLAIRIRNPKSKAPVLCLAGPPGVGKTSIAKSIAKALDKKFIRISLGGAQGAFELRGTSRTYRTARSGRIIDALIDSKSMNPLILLDEIDKASQNSYNGDITAVLLEVLDPGQNNEFRDDYIEIPVDLSKVLFVATANYLDNIPAPVRDRMEIIEVRPYTENEKFHIAKDYLLEKQLVEANLKKEELVITDEAIKNIINNYTREAGVRSLNKKIEAICRRVGRSILQGEESKVHIEVGDLEKWIGKGFIKAYTINLDNEVGVIKGIAASALGGSVSEVEAKVLEGSSPLKITGLLSEGMKESADIALTLVHSMASEYGLPAEFFRNNHFHINIPGYYRKDGPSAGVAMACALLSAVTGKKIKGDIAVTGEITLSGKVNAVGELRKKLIACKTSGIKTVLLPKDCEQEVMEMDKEVTDGLNLEFVKDFGEVSKLIFVER